ncbi:multicopper oxidase domain-containing protein [Caulobacter segnis]
MELHLTGNAGAGSCWSHGRDQAADDSAPFRFQPNERIRIVVVNDTMMSHPMHLHGMRSDLEDHWRRLPGAKTHDRGPAGATDLPAPPPAALRAVGRSTAIFSTRMAAGMGRGASCSRMIPFQIDGDCRDGPWRSCMAGLLGFSKLGARGGAPA